MGVDNSLWFSSRSARVDDQSISLTPPTYLLLGLDATQITFVGHDFWPDTSEHLLIFWVADDHFWLRVGEEVFQFSPSALC